MVPPHGFSRARRRSCREGAAEELERLRLSVAAPAPVPVVIDEVSLVYATGFKRKGEGGAFSQKL